MNPCNSYSHRSKCAFSLSREEEYELIRQAQSGNKQAEGRLVEANRGLIHRIAKDYWRPFCNVSLELEDLEIEGCIGFLIAVKEFDISQGNRLYTFAKWRIWKAVLDAINTQGSAIRIPQDKRQQFSQILKTLGVLRGELESEDLAIEETARRMNMSSADIRHLQNIARNPQSLSDMKYSENSQSSKETVGDSLVDTQNLTPEESALNNLLKEDAARALAALSPKEEMVIRLRFGLDGVGSKTLDEIGKFFDLSGERIRQIELKACSHLRQLPWLRGYVA